MKVVRANSDLTAQGVTTLKRQSKADKLKQDYLALRQYHEKQCDGIAFYIGDNPVDRIRKTNELAYNAFKLLDVETMERLKYNIKQVEREVIITSNANQELKLLQLLNEYFKQGDRVKNDVATETLQTIYNRLQIIDPKTSKIRVAKATQLAEPGRFEIKPCKLPNAKGGYDNGYIILRPQFELRAVA